MRTKEKHALFNRISGVYGLFFAWQVRNYQGILKKVRHDLDLSLYNNVIDIGCGTGALCYALHQYGLAVTGIDPAEKMIRIAQQKTEQRMKGPLLQFMQGDVLRGLPFEDKSFDLAFASYVAHGFEPEERRIMYGEMKRVAKNLVVLVDYNEGRSLITNLVEWLEGGAYFNFIKTVKDELQEQFENMQEINIGKRSSLYLCAI
ncbi:MAG: class I SAM-dependent methyltransferase [Dehalobacterium sp.]